MPARLWDSTWNYLKLKNKLFEVCFYQTLEVTAFYYVCGIAMGCAEEC